MAVTKTTTSTMKTTSQPQQNFASSSSSLRPTLIISGVDSLDSLTEAALTDVRLATSKALGFECRLTLLRCLRTDDEVPHLLVVTASSGPILGAYEVTEYASALRCNQITDAVVTELIANFGSLPGITSRRVQPVSPFTGSKIFPSGTSPNLIVGFAA